MNADTAPLPPGHSIGPMRDDEVAILDGWAAAEGWNPGRSDLAVARAADPDAFVALRRDGELIGGGTVFAYGRRFGFMGLFILRPDVRGAGLGAALWHARLQRLIARLDPDAPIGMDGVFGMVPFYERGGFRLAHRDLRFEGPARGHRDPQVAPIGAGDLAGIERLDSRFFPVPRSTLLRRWLAQPGADTALLREQGAIVGYGVSRPCREGYKLGPVFAQRPDVAERLVAHLMAPMAGARVQLDVPEPNAAGLALAARFGLTESFGCARMYRGPAPALSLDGVFGITSFEFG